MYKVMGSVVKVVATHYRRSVGFPTFHLDADSHTAAAKLVEAILFHSNVLEMHFTTHHVESDTVIAHKIIY